MSTLPSITVEPYLPENLDAIINIVKTLPEWFTEKGIENMNIDLRFQKGFVAIHDAQIIGFLSFFVNEGVAQIAWMGVLREYHRQGIGKRLIDRLISELRRAGVQEIRVNTLGNSVEYEPYERTRAFYRGIGFKDFQCIKLDNPECPDQLTLRMEIMDQWIWG